VGERGLPRFGASGARGRSRLFCVNARSHVATITIEPVVDLEAARAAQVQEIRARDRAR